MNKRLIAAMMTLAGCGVSNQDPVVLDDVGPSAAGALDFALEDVNPTSPSFGRSVGLSDRTTPTAWYFGHAT